MLLASVPIPLPLSQPALAKESTLPFPCQTRACGCQTAWQCWNHCCCFSPAEQEAWAAAHGVTVPAAWGPPGARLIRPRPAPSATTLVQPAATACGVAFSPSSREVPVARAIPPLGENPTAHGRCCHPQDTPLEDSPAEAPAAEDPSAADGCCCHAVDTPTASPLVMEATQPHPNDKTEPKPCCASKKAQQELCPPVRQAALPEPESRSFLCGLDAQRCQGGGRQLLGGWVVCALAPVVLRWHFRWVMVERLSPVVCLASQRSFPPEAPPPRA